MSFPHTRRKSPKLPRSIKHGISFASERNSFELEVGQEADDRSVLSWLSDLDMRSKQSEKINARLRGTGEWLLKSPVFRVWADKEHPSSTLWCPGFPGTGKSVLTAIVIDHVQTSHMSSDTALAFVYCDKSQAGQTALQLLSEICRQLASQKPTLPPQLRKLYNNMTQENERPGIDDILLLIVSLCGTFSHVFVCVDALDECHAKGERAILISALEWLRNHAVRVFVTSRTFNPDISTAFENDRQIQIYPPSQDIQAFLSHCLECNTKLRRDFVVHDKSPDSVFERIITKSRGMFLLANLLLQREFNVPEVKEESEEDGRDGSRSLQQETVAQKLKATSVANHSRNERNTSLLFWKRFETVAQQDPLQRYISWRILDWMLYAKGALRYTDMVQVLMLDPEYDSMSDALATLSEQRVVDMNQGLIHVESDLGELHFTENIFVGVSSQDLDEILPEQPGEMANCCLHYLSLDAIIASDLQSAEDHGKILSPPNRYAFKEYAQKYWGVHASECNDPSLDQRVIEYLKKILKSPARWTELHSTWFGRESLIARVDDETPLHKTARFGLDSIILRLLSEEDFDIDFRSWKGETAMSIAVCAGFVSTVQLLYQHGASLHHQNKFGYSLLHEAAENGDAAMVALLITYGHEPNITAGHDSETPLGRAAAIGRIDAARILLENGASMTIKSRHTDVMQTSARAGNYNFTKLLVEYGYDLSAPTVSGSTPLSIATESGSMSLVQYMVENGANVLERDQHNKGLALHTAAREGHGDLVRYFLKFGADPFQEDERHRTPLGEAISKGHQGIIHTLLPRLDDSVPVATIISMVQDAIDAKSLKTARALLDKVPGSLDKASKHSDAKLMLSALGTGDVEMVQLLIDRGEPVAVQDEHGWSPLHHAINAETALLLLKNGADPNLPTKLGVTPVHLAAESGDGSVLEVLLDHNPDLSMQAIDGSNALVAAGYSGRSEAVKQLLNRGSPVSDFNIDGETVLHHAVIDQDTDLVRFILEHGINLSVQSRKAGSALHLSAFKGFTEITKLLLDYGADVELAFSYEGVGFQPPETYGTKETLPWNSVGIERHSRPKNNWINVKKGWTALHTAACGGHLEVLDMLLRRGAKTSTRGGQGETPTHVAASAAHTEILQALLESDKTMNIETNAGDTLLHYAALAEAAIQADESSKRFKCSCEMEKHENHMHEHPDYSKSECVKLLLRRRADPVRENHEGLTPLALAAKAGHEDIVQVLVSPAAIPFYPPTAYPRLLRHCAGGSAKASVLQVVSEAFDESEEARLAWNEILSSACLSGDTSVVALALSKGGTLAKTTKAPDNTVVNPFHYVISREQHELVTLLLDGKAGADVMATDPRGHNALQVASRPEQKSTLTVVFGNRAKAETVVSLLRHRVPINHRSSQDDCNTALHLAVTTGDPILVSILVRNGASVNIRNKHGATALHAAVTKWIFLSILEILLDAGACASAQDRWGRTPLHMIRSRDDAKTAVRLLVERGGADVSIPDHKGDRAIHYATRRAKWEVVEGLIEAGASVQDRGHLGRTPLHVAAMHGHDVVVEALLALKADPWQMDNNGRTPLRYAEEGGHPEVVAILTGKKKLPSERGGNNKRSVVQRKNLPVRGGREEMNKEPGGWGNNAGPGGSFFDDFSRALGTPVSVIGY